MMKNIVDKYPCFLILISTLGKFCLSGKIGILDEACYRQDLKTLINIYDYEKECEEI